LCNDDLALLTGSFQELMDTSDLANGAIVFFSSNDVKTKWSARTKQIMEECAAVTPVQPLTSPHVLKVGGAPVCCGRGLAYQC
jgi:hypothetical protein